MKKTKKTKIEVIHDDVAKVIHVKHHKHDRTVCGEKLKGIDRGEIYKESLDQFCTKTGNIVCEKCKLTHICKFKL